MGFFRNLKSRWKQSRIRRKLLEKKLASLRKKNEAAGRKITYLNLVTPETHEGIDLCEKTKSSLWDKKAKLREKIDAVQNKLN
ncbi:MAG: hypothetical protein ABIA76_00790 [Candidatus Diapherotrites archaeon]